jgi:hypothetical protein
MVMVVMIMVHGGQGGVDLMMVVTIRIFMAVVLVMVVKMMHSSGS